MTKHRFLLLEVEMVRRGVALRHARRAALELECHHRELADQALARGETPEQAERSAHEALGSDTLLIDRYGFGALANRQRIEFRWPLAGIVLLCVAAAVVNVSFVVTGGPHPGFARAGMSLDLARLPRQLVHAACTAALALAPLSWLRYRASRRRFARD